ncbi:MAG: hypothetical protein ACREQ9_19860 [Candidatus Binatia bacterium]
MYFVTIKRAGYALFSTTPSERMAVGLTENQKRLHLLLAEGKEWNVVREWPVEEVSHTDLMLALGKIEEPADPLDVLKLLPPPQALQ